MHRSGTSMLAGLLNHNGYDIGPNVMPAQQDNPKGFFENTSVCVLNERILQEMDSCWDDLTLDIVRHSEIIRDRYLQDVVDVVQDQFGAADQILIKDPRLCLLYPVWASALHELEIEHGIIIQYRNPFAVARSLHARDKFPLNKGLQLWCNHILSAESLTRHARRAFVDHADLLRNPVVQLHNLLSQIGWPVNDITSMDTSLLDSTLSHHQDAGDDIGMHLPQPVLDLIDLIRNADFSRDTAFDRISEQLGTYRDFFVHRDTQYTTRNSKAEKILNRDLEWFRKHFQEKSRQLNQMNSENDNLRLRLQELEKSLSGSTGSDTHDF
jgi:hypothetical protein